MFQHPHWAGMPPDYAGPNCIQSPPFVDQQHFVIGNFFFNKKCPHSNSSSAGNLLCIVTSPIGVALNSGLTTNFNISEGEATGLTAL